jgi:hypothetical protein
MAGVAGTPLARSKEYTPSLTTGMAAARMRAATNPVPPTIPVAGDLFATQPALATGPTTAQRASSGGGATSVSSPRLLKPITRPSGSMQAVLSGLPTWNTWRPHLTSLDLVAAAQTRQDASGRKGGSRTTGDSDAAAQDALAALPPGAQDVAGAVVVRK